MEANDNNNNSNNNNDNVTPSGTVTTGGRHSIEEPTDGSIGMDDVTAMELCAEILCDSPQPVLEDTTSVSESTMAHGMAHSPSYDNHWHSEQEAKEHNEVNQRTPGSIEGNVMLIRYI